MGKTYHIKNDNDLKPAKSNKKKITSNNKDWKRKKTNIKHGLIDDENF